MSPPWTKDYDKLNPLLLHNPMLKRKKKIILLWFEYWNPKIFYLTTF